MPVPMVARLQSAENVLTLGPLLQPDARIDDAVQHVHDQVAEHQDKAAEQRDPQHRDHVQRQARPRAMNEPMPG